MNLLKLSFHILCLSGYVHTQQRTRLLYWHSSRGNLGALIAWRKNLELRFVCLGLILTTRVYDHLNGDGGGFKKMDVYCRYGSKNDSGLRILKFAEVFQWNCLDKLLGLGVISKFKPCTIQTECIMVSHQQIIIFHFRVFSSNIGQCCVA